MKRSRSCRCLRCTAKISPSAPAVLTQCIAKRLLRLIEQGKINTGPLITHTFPLNRILDAYTIFEHHSEDCVKCAITPFER